MASSFAKGFAGGLASGFTAQRKEAREDARAERLLLMKHYMTSVVPQYNQAKAGAAMRRKQVRAFQLIHGASESEAITSLRATGFKEGEALEFFQTQVKPARNVEAVPQGGLSAQTSAALGKTGPEVTPTQPSSGSPTVTPSVTPDPSPGATSAATGPITTAAPQVDQNFFNEVIIGRKSPGEIAQAVESTIADEFGLDTDEIRAFMADPTIFETELDRVTAPVPTTGFTSESIDAISKELLGNVGNVKTGEEKAVVQGIFDAIQNNDMNSLVEIADKFYSPEELEALEAGSAGGVVKAAQQNVALKTIGLEFGVTFNEDGTVNFGDMKADTREAWGLVTQRVAQHLAVNPNGLAAGSTVLNELRETGEQNLSAMAKGLPGTAPTLAKREAARAAKAAASQSVLFFVERMRALPAAQREQWLIDQNLDEALLDEVLEQWETITNE